MMTYEELFTLCKGSETCDPLTDPDFPERASYDDTGILILGGPDKPPSMTCMNDLRITIEGDKLVLRVRDNEAATGDDIVYGPDWGEPVFFDDFDDLHTWIYES